MADKPAAIVTGGSKGIGGAIACQLARQGYNLMVNHFDSDPQGQPDDTDMLATKIKIEQLGSKCEYLRGDISNATDRNNLIEYARGKFNRCDLLINNAGIAPSKRTDILEASQESFDKVMAVNLKGPYFLTQQIANWMIQQLKQSPDRKCRIVNTSSLSAYVSSPARGEYCISKAGVSMMTMLYADRLAEFGIGVFEIRPGIIATDMTSVVKDKYDKMISEGLTPTKRWGQPEDVAAAVGAITSGSFDFSTGQVINVDGGFHLRRL